MTEPSRRAARRGPGLVPLAGASLAMFAVMFVLLAERVAAGTDPVLSVAHRSVARPVIVRRIVKRIVVDTTIRTHGHAKVPALAESASPLSTSQSGGEAPAPVTRSS